MKINLIAYYGVLAHEKQPLFKERAEGVNPDGIHAFYTAEIPEGLFEDAGKTYAGDTVLRKEGLWYALSELLTNIGDAPAIIVPGRRPRAVRLQSVDPAD